MIVIPDEKKRKKGFKYYLEHGQNNDRDLKDERICLYGDLELYNSQIELYADTNPNEVYRNFVLSFEEDFIPVPILEMITRSFIKQVMKGYEEHEYSAFAEFHKPKIKTKVDENGKTISRKNHVHVSFLKWSFELERVLDLGHNGKKSEKIGGRQEEFNLWVADIEKKYGLKVMDKKAITQDVSEVYPESKTLKNRKDIVAIIDDIIDRNLEKTDNLDELIEVIKDNFFDIPLVKKNGEEVPLDIINIEKSTDKAKTPFIKIELNEKLTNNDNSNIIRRGGNLFSDKTFEKAKENKLKEESKTEYLEPKHEPIEDMKTSKKLEEINTKRVDFLTDKLKGARAEAEEKRKKLDRKMLRDHGKHGFLTLPTLLPAEDEIEEEEDVVIVEKPSFTLAHEVKKFEQKQKIKNTMMDTIKRDLDARYLLEKIKDQFKLNLDLYECWVNEKGEQRIKAGSTNLNITDFLTKEIGIEWEEAKEILESTYIEYINKKIAETPKILLVNVIAIKITYQQKAFSLIYGRETDKTFDGYLVKENEDKSVIIANKAKAITIHDKGSNISSYSNVGDNHTEEVSIMLEIVKAKGWNYEGLEINGSPEFIAEVKRQMGTGTGEGEAIELSEREVKRAKRQENREKESAKEEVVPVEPKPTKKKPARKKPKLKK